MEFGTLGPAELQRRIRAIGKRDLCRFGGKKAPSNDASLRVIVALGAVAKKEPRNRHFWQVYCAATKDNPLGRAVALKGLLRVEFRFRNPYGAWTCMSCTECC